MLGSSTLEGCVAVWPFSSFRALSKIACSDEQCADACNVLELIDGAGAAAFALLQWPAARVSGQESRPAADDAPQQTSKAKPLIVTDKRAASPFLEISLAVIIGRTQAKYTPDVGLPQSDFQPRRAYIFPERDLYFPYYRAFHGLDVLAGRNELSRLKSLFLDSL